MFKKVTFSILSTGLILTTLTGCGDKEEYQKGISLYNKGDYESLIKARQFFEDYASKNPDDSGVEEWFTNVDKSLIKEAKEQTNKAYDSKNYEDAFDYVTTAKELAPKDKDVIKAYSLVKKANSEQKRYDRMSTYLEARYIETNDIVEEWDKAIKLVETGNAKTPYINTVAKTLYPKVIELRRAVNAETFNLTGKNDLTLQESNSILFNYIVDIESGISRVMNRNSVQLSDYKEDTIGLDAETFNATFLSIQDKMSSYVNEESPDGKPKRSIKNTLNFTDAYKKKVNADKKAAEEATKLQQQAATTPQTTTTSPKPNTL
ncbi:hypothetical protein MZM54_04720 [[Brevibacterium] frigoritolerans]|nr:hypothetical protein [Peribacillus frigoritolerans]